MARATITADLRLHTGARHGDFYVECELEAQPGDPIASLKENLTSLVLRQAAENDDSAVAMVEEELAALRRTVAQLEQWLEDSKK
jgi:hypothetical protein